MPTPVKKPLSEEKALLLMSTACARTELCQADIRRKLARYALPDGAEERILRRLIGEHYVDDSRFARAFVRDKFRYNHWGSQRIRFELQKKRIDDNTIDEALTEIDGEEASDTLSQLLRKKLASTKGNSDYEVFMKLLRYAASRGFSPDEAHRCLKQIINTDDEYM